jgi:hypothetical protein
VALQGIFLVVGSLLVWLDGKQHRESQERADRIHQQLVEQHRRAAWQGHLKRLAYDKAHPEEVAERKRKAREQAQQREEQRVAANREAARLALLAEREANAARARQERESHPCSTASEIERHTSGMDPGQAMYDSAASGMHYAKSCDDDDKSVNEGFLLSFKAFAEHALGTGDAGTDLNRAITLLAHCQACRVIMGPTLAPFASLRKKVTSEPR